MSFPADTGHSALTPRDSRAYVTSRYQMAHKNLARLSWLCVLLAAHVDLKGRQLGK